MRVGMENKIYGPVPCASSAVRVPSQRVSESPMLVSESLMWISESPMPVSGVADVGYPRRSEWPAVGCESGWGLGQGK